MKNPYRRVILMLCVLAVGFGYGCGREEKSKSEPAVEFHPSGFAKSHAEPLREAQEALDEIVAGLRDGTATYMEISDLEEIIAARIEDGAREPGELSKAAANVCLKTTKYFRNKGVTKSELIGHFVQFDRNHLAEDLWLSGGALRDRLEERARKIARKYVEELKIFKDNSEFATEAVARLFEIEPEEVVEYHRRYGVEEQLNEEE